MDKYVSFENNIFTLNNCFQILSDMLPLPVNRLENDVHAPVMSPLKTIKDEILVPKVTSTIEGEVDVRRKVSLFAIY
jgi:hypothetical protein